MQDLMTDEQIAEFAKGLDMETLEAWQQALTRRLLDAGYTVDELVVRAGAFRERMEREN